FLAVHAFLHVCKMHYYIKTQLFDKHLISNYLMQRACYCCRNKLALGHFKVEWFHLSIAMLHYKIWLKRAMFCANRINASIKLIHHAISDGLIYITSTYYYRRRKTGHSFTMLV
ncbi:hypothetical protein ACJX0J_032462, partial [Zea mays]